MESQQNKSQNWLEYKIILFTNPDRVLFKVINEGDYGERALASRLLMNRVGPWVGPCLNLYEFFITSTASQFILYLNEINVI